MKLNHTYIITNAGGGKEDSREDMRVILDLRDGWYRIYSLETGLMMKSLGKIDQHKPTWAEYHPHESAGWMTKDNARFAAKAVGLKVEN